MPEGQTPNEEKYATEDGQNHTRHQEQERQGEQKPAGRPSHGTQADQHRRNHEKS
jgi:hypothetical protein